MVLPSWKKNLIATFHGERSARCENHKGVSCKEVGYIISKQSDFEKKHPKSTESTERKVASGRLKTACTEEKVQHVEEVVCSLKDNTESKRS